MPDQVASLLPPGAGRFQDFMWPDPQAANSGAVGAVRPRNGSTVGVGANVLIGGGASALTAVINGVPCIQMIGNTPNIGSQKIMYPGFPVTLRTSRSLISGQTDDTMVYRIVVSMCTLAPAALVNADMGFQLVRYLGGVDSSIVGAANLGIGLQIQDANIIRLAIRGPNGLVTTDLTASPFDTTAWHTFDMRFFNATALTDAFWTLRIDGALQPLSQVNSNWGAVGTNLPANALNGVLSGFVPTMVVRNTLNGFFTYQCHCMCAPNELNCL